MSEFKEYWDDEDNIVWAMQMDCDFKVLAPWGWEWGAAGDYLCRSKPDVWFVNARDFFEDCYKPVEEAA